MENSTPSDEQLITRIAEGDTKAFELLYDRYAAIVMGLASKTLQDTGSAEEVILETFWRVWCHADLIQSHSVKFVDWLSITVYSLL